MPCISSCPECHRDLTIPDAVEAAHRLRCPLCQAEFIAERALADAVAFPPAAIKLDAGTQRLASDQDEEHESQSQQEAAAATGIADERSREEQASQEHSVRVRSKPRPQASAFGLLGQFAGMAFGGVLGLAIGYYVLLWIGGPQADFLELRDKLPGWMTPPNKGNRDDERRGRRRHGIAERSLGDLLRESDGPPSSDVPEQDARAGVASDAVPASFEQASGLPAQPSPDRSENSNSTLQAATDVPPATADLESAAAALVGPRGFSAYSMDDLEAALAKAGAALGCEQCHATGYLLREPPSGPGDDRFAAAEPRRVRCDRCGGKPMPGLTSEAFDQLCQLADAVTFARLGADETARERLRQQIQAALLRVGEDRGKTQIVGRLAGSQLENSQRHSNGIILAGTVQELGQAGPLYSIKLVLFGVPKSVVVLSQQAPEPPLAQHDRVLILGSIVDSPIKNLAGYSGNLNQVVWGGLPLKLLPTEP
jgi:hypothetical protein